MVCRSEVIPYGTHQPANSDQPKDHPVGTSNVEPLYGPNAPCAKNTDAWIRLEAELEAVISWRASRQRKIDAAQPMVQQFCAHCPIVADCYQTAIDGAGPGMQRYGIKSTFTGVAGGTLFHEGAVVIDFGLNPSAERNSA